MGGSEKLGIRLKLSTAGAGTLLSLAIMSVINKDGSLGWKSSEATILACPVGQKLREASTTSQSAHSDGKCVSNMNARIS